MADYWADNAVDSSLDTLGNWWLDAARTVPASQLPSATDNCTLVDFLAFTSGSLTCNSLVVGNSVSLIGVTITAQSITTPQGYFFNCTVNYSALTGTVYISGGTFNGGVQTVDAYFDTTPAVVNGELTITGGSVYSGTFNGNAHLTCSVFGGTFNGEEIDYDGFTLENASFPNPASTLDLTNGSMVNFGTLTINGRVTTDGVTFLYSSNSTAVADPSDVRAGVMNLGKVGTYTAAADYPAQADVRAGTSYDSGNLTGTLDLPAESDVKAGVQYDGGTRTGSAPTLSVEVTTP